MCTVDKMLIKGIRSFSPDNTSVITFYKPLTLIVGPNGAGKTTIIECLKYACTGELPPNARSGHSFIHDPKVAGETETKGQIKLRFKTAAGKVVVCIRSFQLTQRASKMEYKAIESVLQTINSHTGEKVCLSYRCADMDREVPSLIGVSKAILENVIFVHQDEANWPLAEGAVLKKKFDDIFSATRYTKALEVIKKLHKEQGQLIKEYRLKVEHLQTIRDAALKLQENMDNDKQKSSRLQGQIRDLEQKIADGQDRMAEMETTLKDIRRLHSDIEVKKSQRDVLQRQKQQQYDDLEVENEDSDEELLAWQANFEESVEKLRLKIATTERLLSDARLQNEGEKERHTRDATLKGRLQAEADAHAEDKQQRDSCLQAIFSKQLLGNLGPLPLAHDTATQASWTSARRLEERQQGWQKLKEWNKGEDDKLSAAIEAANAKLMDIQKDIRQMEREKDSSREKELLLAKHIESSSMAEGDLKRFEKEEKSTKEAADNAAARLRERDLETKLRNSRTSLYATEQSIRALHREKDSLAAESGQRVKLKMKKEALSEKDDAICQLLADNKTKFAKVLGREPVDTRSLHLDVEQVVSEVTLAYEAADKRASSCSKSVAALTLRLEDAKTTLGLHQQSLDAKRRRIAQQLFDTLQAHLAAEALEAQLDIAKRDMVQKKKDEDVMEGMRMCFGKFIEVAAAKHKCPLCEKPFVDDQEEEAFVEKQRTAQDRSEERLEGTRQERNSAQKKVAALEGLRPLYEDLVRLEKESIPSAEKAVADCQAALEKALDEQDDLLGLLSQATADRDAAKELEAPASEMQRLGVEVAALRREVSEQEYRLDVMSQGLRTIADISAELAILEGERDEMSRRTERMYEEQQQLKDESTAWNLRWRNAREAKMEAQQRVTELNRMKAERHQLLDDVARLERDMQAAQQMVEPVQREQSRLGLERNALRKRALAEEGERHEEVHLLQRDMDHLQLLAGKIDQYILAGKEEKLEEIASRMARSLVQQANYEAKIAEVSEQLVTDQQLLQSQATVKRNIDDNINYRRTLAEESRVSVHINELERQLVVLGEAQHLEKQLRQMASEVSAWAAEQNQNRGTMAAYEANIASNRAELKAVQYKEIDERYRSQLIQLKTTEMANKDLDKFSGALDRALMRFHSMKMEEINKIVKELWQQTYRGQDIDFIEIRSDTEGAGTRSYSYRVVMRSGDAELDMRGRCSAGQKVLASLIIRLALAETFCLNCGILALDEPTTNLDTPNAESLAAALLRIMEERRGQENFQLIVITHDEKFAQLIGQKQHAERYYRISKDDNQHSRIEVQDIFE